MTEKSSLDNEYFAWKFYCEDTSGTADVRDYFEDLSQIVKDFYLDRAIRSVVVCAANKFSDGLIVCGARHYDRIMHLQIKNRFDEKSVQGFINQFGNFLTREEAWIIAKRQNQIIRRVGGDTAKGGTLYSENLY